MNNYILVGKIVNTHGIKGEIRILSSFDRKDLAFKVGNSLYIGDNKIEEKINTYRVHKEFDMVSFERYSNINEVLKYLKQNVYIKREDLKLNDNEYILEDLINMDIIDNGNNLGKVSNFIYNNGNTLLEVTGIKKFYIPINSNYIEKVDLLNKVIITNNAKDLII